MSIQFDEQNLIFYLHTKNTTYVLAVSGRDLVHVYWGARLPEELPQKAYPVYKITTRMGSSMSVATAGTRWRTLDNIMQEYPTFGSGDLREPAFHAEYADGSRASELGYVGYTITAGKPAIPGLPEPHDASCSFHENAVRGCDVRSVWL